MKNMTTRSPMDATNTAAMNPDIGPQYTIDRQADPTGFLERARLHQSRFRAENLCVPCARYGNYLLEADARNGLNFFQGHGIRQAAKKRYPTYNRNVYANMLRSEHIPLNLFIPLNTDDVLRKKVFSEWLGFELRIISEVRIEYAPMPRSEYLNDLTSFDAYVEYEDEAGLRGLVGIEVKYTECGTALPAGSKEERDLADRSAPYRTVMTRSGIYRTIWDAELTKDVYRQMWRNQLLGESVLQRQRFAYSTLILVHPAGNEYVTRACEGYRRFLLRPQDTFVALTYERFIALCRQHARSTDFAPWLDYLETRYIINT